MASIGRRRLIGGAAAAAASGIVLCSGSSPPNEQATAGNGGSRGRPFTALREGDSLSVADGTARIAERAYQLGYDLEKRHGGCARCTVAALQEALDSLPVDEGLRRAAAVLDGGATPKGIQNCVAFTGAGMFLGWLCGTDDFERPALARKLIRQVYANFETRYGSVLCKDVKEKAARDCPTVVALASRWTVEAVLAQFVHGAEKEL